MIQLVSPSSVFADKNGWTCVQGVSCYPVSGVVRNQNHWQKKLNTFSMWVTLLCLSRSVSLMKMLNMIQRVSCAPVFEQFRTTHKNGWICCVQGVSCSPVSSVCLSNQNWLTIAEYASSMWVAFYCLRRSEPLNENDWSSSSWWVLQCLSRSE